MRQFRDIVVENEEIILSAKEHNFLGPAAVFRNCNITLPLSAKSFTLANAEFEGCTFHSKQKFANVQGWCKAVLTKCAFFGEYVGHDFGSWREVGEGSIRDCDFSNATLNGCRFIGCDMGSITLPRWPCFTILNPHTRSDDIAALTWPGKLKVWAEGLSWSPPETVAEVNLASQVVTRFGSTEVELRECLTRLGGVVL